MTRSQLILRNLFFHWRSNSAVFLGIVVSTTVLTGALLVGDALRGSLRQLTMERLGWIDRALVGPRLLRETVIKGLSADRISPALILRATARRPGDNAPTVRQVQLIGVDLRFWGNTAPGDPSAWNGEDEFVILNMALANKADVAPQTDELQFRVQKTSEVPRESPLARQDPEEVLESFQLPVDNVLDDTDFGSRFHLQPTVDTVYNAFVPLHALQKLIKQPGRINAIFVKGGSERLATELKDALTLDDWGLRLQTPRTQAESLIDKFDRNGDGKLTGTEWYRRAGNKRIPKFAASMASAIKHANDDVLERSEIEAYYREHHPYLSLESQNLLLEPLFVHVATEAAKDCHLRTGPTLAYLANTIQDVSGNKAGASIPYSVVAALDPTQKPPLGPFLPPGAIELADDQIVLVDWKNSPMPFHKDMTVELTYFAPEQHGEYQEDTARFRVAGTGPLALTGAAADPDLTPEFPGLTDRMAIRSWDPPFPFDGTRIKPGDANEVFWEQYRTTPKAYVTLATGQKLWGSRFGNLTSIRLAAPAGMDLEKAAEDFRKALLAQLPPDKGGLVFENVKADALQASSGGTDFAVLFAGFSFFLIAAALLLVGLLFRLNLDHRASEIGLLLATGYRRGVVILVLLGEGLGLVVLGAAVGCGLALSYAALLVQLLNTLWPGETLQSFLHPDFSGSGPSLAIGFASSVFVGVLTIALTLWGLARVPARVLLADQTSMENEAGLLSPPRWSWRIASAALVLAVVTLCLSGLVHDHEMKAVTFFASGGLLLTAALAGLSGWMRGGQHLQVEGPGWGSIARLGVRNAARNPLRSMLTAGLLASAAFLIVAVESFRRHTGPQVGLAGPSGGFNLIGESDLPAFLDPQTDESRKRTADKLLIAFRDQMGGDEAAAKEKADNAMALIRSVEIIPLRLHGGDDASCLNLYQVRQPRLLGIPRRLINQDGFQFAATVPAASEAEQKNPWLLLDRSGEAVPVFGEENTVTWMLKKSVGGELKTVAGNGAEKTLRISGLLKDSVFQSSLLLSEARFLELYPGSEGFKVFLIKTPPGEEKQVQHLLELAPFVPGLEITPSAERLASFLAVENTYLSTFQALGGLGLILGSLGLAVVLLRSVWERRAELALLRALGYRRATLGWMVLAENGFLLLVGLAAGTLAALLSVLPQIALEAGAIPWKNLAILLGLVPVVGLTAAVLAVIATLRAPLIPALRRE